MSMGKRQQLLGGVYFWMLLFILLAMALFPFYWMILTSLRPNAEIYSSTASLLPKRLSSAHYWELLNQTSFLYYFRNSIMVATLATLIGLGISFPAAFAITNLKMKGRELIAKSILFTYLVPASLLFIPMFSLVNFLGLGNQLAALVVTYLTFSVPFCTWLLMGYLKSVPHELMEAAQIDGCSKLGTMTRIILPLAAPGVAAAAIFAFTLAWNEFLYALVFITSDIKRTIPVGIGGLIMGDVYQWGMIMAAAVMASVPAILLYTVAQRFIVQGMTAGGVKG
jgi:multiple sugar transport system permease protein